MTRDTGAQASGWRREVSNWPPTDSPSLIPSPVTLRRVRHHLRQPLAIVGKTAAGQHHGASFDVNLPAVAAQHRAGHARRTLQQPDHRGIELKTHAGVEGGSQQTGDQRIAIDQMLPPSGA